MSTGRMVTLKESDALRAMPAMNPQALLAAAVDKGASVETLERLVALAKDMRAMTAKEAFDKAMSEFQRRCPPIKKNKTMAVPGRPTYKYADLGEILSTIAPLMGELGLSISWRSVAPSKPNYLAKICIISHEMGHEKDSGPCELPTNLDGNRMNGAQSIGSTETYAKRYSLCSVLGISPEDDTDANDGTEGRTHGEADRKAREANADRAPAGIAKGTNPAEITVPSDPNDPALVAESHTLFPDPETERINTEIHKIINTQLALKTITPKNVREFKKTYLGAEDADPSKCDIAALTDLRKYLATRFER